MDGQVHKGHRQRMRRKFADFGARVFDTYELLEMLLYHSVPVRDTNPIAKKLLSRFGSLEGVFSASEEELMEVEEVGEATATLIRTVGDALLVSCSDSENLIERRIFDSYEMLGEYIADAFLNETDYSLMMLSFDNDMNLLATDKLYEVDFSSGAVLPNAFVDTAVKCGASVAVLAHSHPYGPLCPTVGDRETNTLVERALADVGVFLLEHYVVCGDRYVGFMNHLSTVFSQKPMAKRFFESKLNSRR